jgi:addiction module RelE/StbE family toxin
MKLNRTSKFGREYVKFAKHSLHILNKIDYVIKKLEVNPFEPSLRTHKLKGKLEGIWACKVTEDIRILFEIDEDENKELCILLLSVGKHEEVY